MCMRMAAVSSVPLPPSGRQPALGIIITILDQAVQHDPLERATAFERHITSVNTRAHQNAIRAIFGSTGERTGEPSTQCTRPGPRSRRASLPGGLLLLIVSDVHCVIAPSWLPRSVAIMCSEKVSTLLLLIAFLMLLISIACSTMALST